MHLKSSSYHVFVLYDSITNTVFEGQILKPLRALKKTNPSLHIILISFEKIKPSQKLIEAIKKANIELIFHDRYLFMGLLSLKHAIHVLKKDLKMLPNYTLSARGPHVGWLCIKAALATQCKNITIQARGLLAEEYAYVHRSKNILLLGLHTFRKLFFKRLEKKTYSYQGKRIPLQIEAVSNALKKYLIDKFNANPSSISIATHDIPEHINTETQQTWRTAIRTKLGITPSAHVYCYNGSAQS